MRDYDRKKPDGKSQLYSSQGQLREGKARKKRDGADHLTGYRPREQEGNARPREAGRLENTFGDIAVGTNRKKELTMVTSRRRTQEGPAVREDEKVLKGESAKKMERTCGTFLTNSHSKEESAVAYRQSYRKTPQMMLNQFRTMMEQHDQQTAKKQASFLSRKAEREELKALRDRELELRSEGRNEARAELRAVERRRQELQQRLVEKEGQERHLRQILEKAREEAERRSEESWERPFTLSSIMNIESSENDGEEPFSEGEPGGEEPSDDEKGDQICDTAGTNE